MSVQALALITITDREILAKYREAAGAALARHGGTVVAGDPSPVVLEAAGDVPDVTALLSFPSLEAAKGWREDPALSEVHALRNAAGRSTIIVLPN